MKTPRHRCHYCQKLSVCRRVIDSGGMSSEIVWVCRAAKSCRKRMEGAGVIFQTFATNPPKSYVKRSKATGHKPITADYAVWLVKRGISPAVVPARFTTAHLDQLPPKERQRWLRTERRRFLAVSGELARMWSGPEGRRCTA